MKKFYLILLVFTVGYLPKMNAQCTFTSTDGYVVTVKATPVSVIAPSSCPYGYNYNLTVNYTVAFSGIHIPSNLYTLQGNIYCNGQANFFTLPTNAGSGTVTSVSNPYRGTTDCASASLSSLLCTTSEIIIQGSGMPYQTSTCPLGGILPVNIISFNAKLVNNNSVFLKWVTATETGNKAFVIERSTDSRNWQAIKTLNGTGNSATNTEYSYTDENLTAGMYYYRLKQTDVSGAVTYSNIIGANVVKGAATDIYISNASSNQLYISGLSNYNEWEMAIVNTTGAGVLRSAALSSNIVQLPVLSAGVYILKLRNKLSGSEKTIKFIKS